jgi:hypothetical protein
MGRTAQQVLLANLSKPILCKRLCDRFEQALARA